MKDVFFDTKISRNGLAKSAAVFIIASGLIHLVIAPLHFAHALSHGLFLAFIGIAEVAWGIAFLREPSASLNRIGMVLAGGLTTLWVLTRLLPSPFGHGQEEIEVLGFLCTLCQSMGMVALAAFIVTSEATMEKRFIAMRNTTLLMAVSVILGVLIYSTALAADSVLAPGSDHSMDNHNGSANDKHHQPANENHYEPVATPEQLNDRYPGKARIVKEAVITENFQEIDLTINASGYSPNVIIAQRGTPLKINVHSEENAGCASKVVFPAINIEKTIPAGSTGLIEILPADEGTFEFMCPMAMVRGELIIK